MLYTLGGCGGWGGGMGKETDEDITQTNIFSDDQEWNIIPYIQLLNRRINASDFRFKILYGCKWDSK